MLAGLLCLCLFTQAAVAASILKYGSRGQEVRDMQQKLKEYGYLSGAVDGIFGKQTLEAVKKFQAANGLAVDGIAGPKTLSKLYQGSTYNPPNNNETNRGNEVAISRILKVGSRGEDVKTLQNYLNSLGFSVGKVDGIFGPATKNAVINFQKSKGLVADGIVGPATLGALAAAINKPGNDKPSNGDKGNDSPSRGDVDRPSFSPWKPATGKISLVWDRNLVALKKNNGINVVAPVWFSVKEVNGQITVDSSKASKNYVNQAHGMGYKVWATVQSFTPSISKQVVQNDVIADHVVAKLVEFVQAYGLDGINIDFENMDPADKHLYTKFVEKAVQQLHIVGATVSVDITRKTSSATNWWSSCYDRASLAKVVDYIILMSYDEHSQSSKTNGPVASIGWVENSIKVTLQEVPADKLLLGVPLYAYDWISEPVVEQPNPANPSDYQRKTNGVALRMQEIEDLVTYWSTVLRNGNVVQVSEWLTEPKWLTETGTMYLKFLDTQGRIHELWYEDAESIKLKLDLVDKYGLAGAASWEYTFANEKIWEVFKNELGQ